MSETEYSQENIAVIRTRLDNLERMTRLAIASNPNSQTHVEAVFKGRAGSADLYMALAGGPRSQDELVKLVSRSQSTVSKIITHLYESGLVDRTLVAGRVHWMWHEMERTLGISRVAKRLSTKPAGKAQSTQQGSEDLPTE